MTDLEIAVDAINNHALALCKDGEIVTSDKRGVSALVGFIDDNMKFDGYSAADIIVGKAAAMMFVKLGVGVLYAGTLSRAGAEYLKKNNVEFSYGEMCDRIINRAGTDICPMEKAAADTEDYNEGYLLIKKRMKELASVVDVKNAQTAK